MILIASYKILILLKYTMANQSLNIEYLFCVKLPTMFVTELRKIDDLTVTIIFDSWNEERFIATAKLFY